LAWVAASPGKQRAPSRAASPTRRVKQAEKAGIRVNPQLKQDIAIGCDEPFVPVTDYRHQTLAIT
jgi:hypothetical protein